ncbi:MAG: hydrogenase formation protein HypD, partial [Pirellulaceae bacterium]
RLLAEIRRTVSTPRTIMEVCGGQTHGLLRYGIDQELENCVRLIHGPGCPVCVTPLESIDFAMDLAREEEVWITTFGDMIRVPGSRESLLQVRADTGNVRMVYSPLDAVQLAHRHPDQQVVFFAVGFETTAPATALAVQQAAQLELQNFSLLVAHVRVQPAMEMLAASADRTVEAFLAAGHVCTVAGFDSYEVFARQYQMPVVVTGFEPLDLLNGILECVRQLEQGEASVCNQYRRSAQGAGNRPARDLVDTVYEPCDRPWRGIGVVPGGGLKLRDAWMRFDAERRFHTEPRPVAEPAECRSGEVLIGRLKPTECECFGNRCRPDSPLGAPMVSAEGACAAYYRYTARPK